MAKKKKTKKQTKKRKRKKLTLAEKKKYIRMAGYGKGKEYLLGVKMLGGIPGLGMGMGPGTHAMHGVM